MKRAGVVKKIQATAPASLMSQSIDAVVAALGGTPASAFRCKLSSFTAAQLPADNVFPDDDVATYGTTTSIDNRFRFFVRHMAAAVDGADLAADARFVRGQQLLLADPYLGGLVTFTRYLGGKWERETGETPTVAFVAQYEVEFSTSRSDPSQPGI